MSATSIYIVDDHQIVIDGLISLLTGASDIVVAGSTTDSAAAVEDIIRLQPHVLLTDVMMPGLNGQQLARKIRTAMPHVGILALSMSGQADIVDEMINDADINGYVLKNIGKAELLTAIRKIANGVIYFSDEVLSELSKAGARKKQDEQAQLTQREIEIIRLIEKELSNRQIAEALFISERTVETHRKNIFRKTNCNSLIGLVKYAYEQRLIAR